MDEVLVILRNYIHKLRTNAVVQEIKDMMPPVVFLKEHRTIEFKLPRRMGNTTIGTRLAEKYKSLYVVSHKSCIDMLESKPADICTKRQLERYIRGKSYDLIVYDSTDIDYELVAPMLQAVPDLVLIKVGTGNF